VIRLRRVSAPFLLGALLLFSLSIPWMVEAIFPGNGGPSTRPPEEVPLWNDGQGPRATAADTAANRQWEADAPEVAWAPPLGSDADALGDSLYEDPAVPANRDRTPPDKFRLGPGVFVSYERSWDNLETARQIVTGGAYVYLSTHSRVTGAVRELRFWDDADGRLRGRGGWLEGFHRLNERWTIDESIGVDTYEGLHASLHGHARGAWLPTEDLYASFTAQWTDLWERLPAIEDKIRLFVLTPYLYYKFLRRAWVEGYVSRVFYSDDNRRHTWGAETGYFLVPDIGLSLSAGAESHSFRENKPLYWSPDYYALFYGRLRATRNYDENPFTPWPREALSRSDRLGYVAEYLIGVDDDRGVDHLVRGGLSWRAGRRVRLKAEMSHLESANRFDDNYAENRVEGRIDVGF